MRLNHHFLIKVTTAFSVYIASVSLLWAFVLVVAQLTISKKA